MLSLKLTTLAAEAQTSESLRALKLDTPESFEGWLGLAALVAVVLAYVGWMYVRDTRAHSLVTTVWLLLLRVAALAVLLVIWLNPQERTQKMSFRPSRVAVLVDTSLSMDLPESVPPTGSGTGSPPTRSRTEAVRDVLARSPLIEDLRERHEVSLYTFDAKLEDAPWRVLYAHNDRAAAEAARKAGSAGGVESDPAAQPTEEEWNEWLRPRGLETRLGEALLDAMKKFGGRTLSGIVVLTDGASNAGVDPNSAHDYAVANKTRLVTVGVGSTEKQVNLKVARIQAPTDVHVGDAYDLSAFVQGQGLEGRTAKVELLIQKGDDAEADAQVADTQEVVLAEDGVPVEVKFTRQPSEPGGLKYTVRTELLANLPESFADDNREEFTVNILDRKLRVLLVAGGPTRDYRFVRNMLYRHPAIDVSVWLQSVDPATVRFVSQEADEEMLTSFPEEPAQLIDREEGYDAILFFDPDWSQISEEGRKLLVDWIANHNGGAIFVAGDVYTPSLASAEDLAPIREIYPVLLSSYLLDYQFDSDSDQPWPVGFTREGENAGLLQLAEDPVASANLWKQFDGVYRTYPTAGAKAGATVYAEFTDTRAQTEHGQPVLMASQFYGSGRTFYIGSPEVWRLRSLSDEYYDRFWTKLIREVAQGRLSRGTSRGMLVPERKEYYLGQTVRVRARLLDAQYQPLVQESVVMEVYDPSGKLITPSRQLIADRNRPGEYFGDFRASLPGRYRLELPIPDTNTPEVAEVNVTLPDLESAHPEQDANTLVRLAQDTGGAYLQLEELPERLASLLPDRSEEFLVDERLRTQWDRDWVLFLVVGLLSIEWLTRKLLKLA